MSIEVKHEDFSCISGDSPEKSLAPSIATQRSEGNQTCHLLYPSIFHSYMENKTNIHAPSTYPFFFQVVALFN